MFMINLSWKRTKLLSKEKVNFSCDPNEIIIQILRFVKFVFYQFYYEIIIIIK